MNHKHHLKYKKQIQSRRKKKVQNFQTSINLIRPKTVVMEMVIFVFNTHTKLMIPRHRTLSLDAQNTQDHGLALHWTRDMPRASQHFYEASQPCGAAAVSLPARAKHGMIMRAHAAHSTQLLESFSTICGGRQEVKKSTSTKLSGSCGSKRGTHHEHMG